MERKNGEGMEGWLYLIRSNRFRITHPRKRYFTVAGSWASFYKDKPATRDQTPMKSGIIDPYTRVSDHGRESIHRRVYFVFTLFDSYNHEDTLKFGAKSAEDAAKWMKAFKDAAEQSKPPGNDRPFVPSGGKRHQPFSISGRKGSGLVRDTSGSKDGLHREDSTTSFAEVPDWTGSLLTKDVSPDVIVASPWQIFGCKNGLRLFRETSDHEGITSKARGDDPPALMAVGVVNGSCEAILEMVMGLGPSRAEWDFCFLRGRVIEHIDGHSDLVHKQYNNYWLPWRMKPRDLLLHRYWRREADGSYVLLYHSVTHEKCPTRPKFVRACLKSGGYVISPLDPNEGCLERSLVKHMLTVDWRDWKTFFSPSRDKKITLHMLERIAAIREVFKVKSDVRKLTTTVSELHKVKEVDEKLLHEGKEDSYSETELPRDGTLLESNSVTDGRSRFLQLADDEFYDASEQSSWGRGSGAELDPLNASQEYSDLEEISDEEEVEGKTGGPLRVSAAASLVKRLHDMAAAAQKHPRSTTEDLKMSDIEGSLPKGMGPNSSSCWNMADASTFLIRGKQYLENHKKVKAQDPIMQLVAADWFKSDKCEDHIAARSTNPMKALLANQKKRATGVADPFFFIINLQVPGSTSYSLVLYYMISEPISSVPLLESFVNADDRFRNSRFKLIPNIAKGSWIAKQSVGKTACLVGEALEITYFSGDNYLELDVDIGSSSVAKGVVNLVIGYLEKLIIEMAFLIQANTNDELPEHLLGTCRIINLDMGKAVPPPPG